MDLNSNTGVIVCSVLRVDQSYGQICRISAKYISTPTRAVGARRMIFQISTVAGLFIVAIVEVLGITDFQKRLDDVDVKIDAVSQRLDRGVFSHPSAVLAQAPAVLVTPPRVAPVQPLGQLAVLITPPIVVPIRPLEPLTIPHPYRPARPTNNR
jgi:hypothetical protein